MGGERHGGRVGEGRVYMGRGEAAVRCRSRPGALSRCWVQMHLAEVDGRRAISHEDEADTKG